MAARQDQHDAGQAGGDAEHEQRPWRAGGRRRSPRPPRRPTCSHRSGRCWWPASCARPRRRHRRKTPCRARPARRRADRWPAGARQRSPSPRARRQQGHDDQADNAQRMTDSEAGPNCLRHRPPDDRIEREAGGHEGEQEEVHEPLGRRGVQAFADPRPLCARLSAHLSSSAAGIVAGLGKRHLYLRDTGDSEQRAAGLRHDATGTRPRPARASAPAKRRRRLRKAASPAETRRSPPARAASDAEVADFVRRMKELAPAHGRRPRPAGVRHGRHHEPPADLGHGARPAGRDVPGREGGRRARRAAHLFPRRRRMPRLAVGVATPTRWPR